jgi:hypothetical protein
MKRRIMIRQVSRCFLPAILLSLGLVRSSLGITISTDMSATSLRATDTLALRVIARWPGGEELFRFATPRPASNPALRLTGQSVAGNTFLENGEFVSEKIWHFDFVCVSSGSTQVVPPTIVYTNTQSGAVDSVAPAPMLLAIQPPPPPPFDYVRLLYYLVGVVIIIGIVYAAIRIFRRYRLSARQEASRKTPEEQTLELLQELQGSMREDRCEQFYTMLEKIVLGLWEARSGTRLSGKTPPEVAASLRASGIAEEQTREVQEVLTDCYTVRFGGGRISMPAMEMSFGTVTSWVKPKTNS